MSWRRFAVADACAAALWASFATALGYSGGRIFEGTWQAVAVSLALAFILAALSGAVRRKTIPDDAELEPCAHADDVVCAGAGSFGSNENRTESIRRPLKG